MTSRTLAAWRVLDEQGAFGERRQDMRIAKMTAALIANMPMRKPGRIRVADYCLAEFGASPAPAADLSVERFDTESRGGRHA